jgi:DNA-nicking Smr family endonuclease
MSVLKTQVVNFLKQHPQVLAFHSCPPKDGGTGAIE